MLRLVKSDELKDEQESVKRHIGFLSKKLTIGLRQDFHNFIQKENPRTKKEIDLLFRKVLDRFRRQVPRS